MDRINLILLLALVALTNSLTLDVPASHQMMPVSHQTQVESPCDDGEQVVPNTIISTANGCGSKPWNVKLGKALSPYLKYLTQCCNAHDHCYDKCAVQNFKDAFDKCNNDFKDCMHSQCDDNVKNYISRKICKANAKTFYQLVHKFGQGPWNAAQQKHCDCE